MTEREFFNPGDPMEACELLTLYGEKAHVLAGGTDLMVMINRKELRPKVLISIGESGLNYIREDGNDLIIGATTSFTDIMHSTQAQKKVPLLTEVISHIASPATRNVATIGGNLANGSPAADSAAALLALGANLKLISKNCERIVACHSFFTGPGQTVLRPDELLQEISIPIQSAGTKWGYRRIGRRKAQTVPIAAVAVYCHVDGRKCREARISMVSVAPIPKLAVKAAALLKGKPVDSPLIESVAKTAANETDPIDDVRSTAWYRRHVVEVLVKHLFNQIFG